MRPQRRTRDDDAATAWLPRALGLDCCWPAPERGERRRCAGFSLALSVRPKVACAENLAQRRDAVKAPRSAVARTFRCAKSAGLDCAPSRGVVVPRRPPTV
jgi:hypothetical protein